MTTEYLIKEGTPIVWAKNGATATDYDQGNQVGGTRTHNLNLTDLQTSEARQGIKVDLSAKRALRYAMTLSVEFKAADTPESGELVALYWGPSGSATLAVANQGGLVGTDAVYTGTAGDSLLDSLKQLKFVGAIVLTSDVVTVVQRDTFIFSPPTRYGQPVVVNLTNTEDFNDVDALEMYVRMVPLINEGER